VCHGNSVLGLVTCPVNTHVVSSSGCMVGSMTFAPSTSGSCCLRSSQSVLMVLQSLYALL